jgi:hypothetical protein
MAFRDVKRALRPEGITITRPPYSHCSYRVNYLHGLAATAYYTDDLDDAFDTGMSMAAWLRNRIKESQ